MCDICIPIIMMLVCIVWFNHLDLQVEDFVEHIGTDGLYGIQLDTVNSLILSLLPPMDFEFQCFKERALIDVAEDIRVHMLRLLIQCLRRCCGFYIHYVCTYIYMYMCVF